MAASEREQKPTWHPDFIRDLSEKVYRAKLEGECKGNVERMIEKDGDQGQKLRGRAVSYDALSRGYLEVLGFTPPAK